MKFSSFLKSLCLGVLAASSLAVAADAPQKADLKRGEALYLNGDAARNVLACVACHGTAGNSTITVNPVLAGQHEAYTLKQLADFKGPERPKTAMTAIAQSLSDADMRDISAYLAQQAPKPGAAKNKDTVEFGKKIYRGGISAKNVPACAACHTPTGAGIPAQFARLAGQHQDYTEAQLKAFRAGDRKNSAQMTTIAERLSDAEIKAVSDYIAGLK